jgi:hypothetical protein
MRLSITKTTTSRHCSITYFWCPFTVYKKIMGSNITINAKLVLHYMDSHACKQSVPPFNFIHDLKRKRNQTSADFKFKASQRRYGRYKNCTYLHSIKVCHEKVSTNLDVASPFPAELKNKQELPNYLSISN